MKKSIKVLLTVLALSLMVCTAFAMTAFANEESAPYATILKKNVEYGSELYLYFGVDDTSADGKEIEVLIYTEDPIANPDSTAFKATKTDKVSYTPDPTKPVYRSFGIPASGVVDEFYIVPRVVGYDIDYSKMVTYSVIEYLLDMRLTATDSEDIDLYNALITYATAAQNKFDYKTNTLAKDFVYAEIIDGTFKNGKTSVLGIKGLEEVLNFNGTIPQNKEINGWSVTKADVTTIHESNDIIIDESCIICANYVDNVETFEAGVIPSTIPTDGSYAPNMSIVDYMGSKRLAVSKSENGGGWNTWNFAPEEVIEDATEFIWEADVIIAPGTNPGGNYDFSIRTWSGQLFNYKISNNTSIGTYESTLGNWVPLGSSETVISLKFVYKLIDNCPTVEIYLGGNLVLTDTITTPNPTATPSSIRDVEMGLGPYCEGHIYFDNYRCVMVK